MFMIVYILYKLHKHNSLLSQICIILFSWTIFFLIIVLVLHLLNLKFLSLISQSPTNLINFYQYYFPGATYKESIYLVFSPGWILHRLLFKSPTNSRSLDFLFFSPQLDSISWTSFSIRLLKKDVRKINFESLFIWK